MSVLFPLEVCVGLRKASWAQLLIEPLAEDEVQPMIWIRGKEYALLDRYPNNSLGTLCNDNGAMGYRDSKLTSVLWALCTTNPEAAQPHHSDTKADLINKHVFRDWL